jgi:hypothetical protein
MLWGHKFSNIFLPPANDGIVRIDLALLDGTEAVALPEVVASQ